METKPYECRRFGNSLVVSVVNHCEVADALRRCCADMNVTAGEITGIGAVSQATLRIFDPATKQYVDHLFDEQMEIANLTGNVSLMEGKTYIHLHAVLGREDCTALAGHLESAVINGAGEFVITAYDGTLERYHNSEIGLNLYRM